MNEKAEKLLKAGATVGVYGAFLVALIAAVYANPATLPVMVQFVASIGANVMATILERVANKEITPEQAFQELTEMHDELRGLKNLIEQNDESVREGFRALKIDLDAVAQDFASAQAEDRDAHGDILEGVLSLTAAQANGFAQVIRKMDVLARHTDPKEQTDEDRRSILMAYAQAIINKPSYTLMSTGGLTADPDHFETTIREPKLEDTFIEPNLASVASLQELREEIAELFEAVEDEEIDASAREQARKKLLDLQGKTWERTRKEGGAQPASVLLKENRAVVVLGDPGSGKSTLLRWLLIQRAKQLAKDGEDPIPILVPIGEYANNCKQKQEDGMLSPLAVYLIARADSEHTGMGDVLRRALEPHGQGVLLLLDGLDEVPRELRRKAARGIQDLISEQTGEGRPSQVIVSSRFFGYQEAPITDPAVQLVVVPFADEQIKAFAVKWHLWLEGFLHPDQPPEAEAEAKATRFREVLFAKPQVKELARNPLMLAMIAVVVRQGKQLPERRVELYDLVLRQLVTRWHNLRSDLGSLDTLDVDYGDVCDIWAPIARWMHGEGTGAIHEDDLLEKLRSRLRELNRPEKAEEWLTVRGDRCCLLQEAGPRLFGFLHQTFQEYFAAMDIYREGEFVPELKSYVEDPRWHEVLHLACGYLGVVCGRIGKESVTQLLARSLDSGSRFEGLIHRDLFLASSCISDNVKPKRELEQTVVERLLKVASSDEMRATREQAMEFMRACHHVALEHDSAQRHVAALITDEDQYVRLLLMEWLVRQPNYTLCSLLDKLYSDPVYGVKNAALAFGYQRNPDDKLIDLHLSNTYAFLTTIDRAPSPRPSFRYRPRRSFWAFFQPGFLIDANGPIREEGLRNSAQSYILSRLQHGSAFQRLASAATLLQSQYRDVAVDALGELITHSIPRIHFAAAKELAYAKRQEGVDELLRLARNSEEELRVEAIRTFRSPSVREGLDMSKAVETAEQLLDDDSIAVRLASADLLLYDTMDERACPALRDALRHPDEDIRCLAGQMTYSDPYVGEATRTLMDLWAQGSERVSIGPLGTSRTSGEHAIVLRVSTDYANSSRLVELVRYDEEIQRISGCLAHEKASVRSDAALVLLPTAHGNSALGVLRSILKEGDQDARRELCDKVLDITARSIDLTPFVRLLDDLIAGASPAETDVGAQLYEAAWLRAMLLTRRRASFWLWQYSVE